MAYGSDVRYSEKRVYGSNAYAYDTEYEIEEEIRQRENADTQVRQKRAEMPQTRYGISPVSVLGLALAAFMVTLSVFAYVRLAEVSAITTELEERLDVLSEENRRLKIAYEIAFDTSEIEEYAITVLGMQTPTEWQTTYLDVSQGNRAFVIQTDEAEGDTFSDIVKFAFSLFEYF